MTNPTRWRPPPLYRAVLFLGTRLMRLLFRVEVSGELPRDNPHGLIVASNHIGPFDPLLLGAACYLRGVAPRFLAHEGLFTTPVLGWVLRHGGQIRVDRGKPTAAVALAEAREALARGSAVVIYPEGRIGLDPQLWPERGKTGTGRLALATGAPLLPVAIWGSHEVLPYAAPRGMWPVFWRAVRRRQRLRVHFGEPIEVSDVDADLPGAAQRLTDRLMDAITSSLASLRTPSTFVDTSRPVSTQRSRVRR